MKRNRIQCNQPDEDVAVQNVIVNSNGSILIVIKQVQGLNLMNKEINISEFYFVLRFEPY